MANKIKLNRQRKALKHNWIQRGAELWLLSFVRLPILYTATFYSDLVQQKHYAFSESFAAVSRKLMLISTLNQKFLLFDSSLDTIYY